MRTKGGRQGLYTLSPKLGDKDGRTSRLVYSCTSDLSDEIGKGSDAAGRTAVVSGHTKDVGSRRN